MRSKKTRRDRLVFLILAIALVVIIGFTWREFAVPRERDFLTGLAPLDWFLARVFPETTTPEALEQKYASSKLKVLLVPGHDNEHSGAVFGLLTEANLNLELARYLNELFSNDEKFESLFVRDFATGDYVPTFNNYFTTERAAILNFMNSRKELLRKLIDAGEFERHVTVNHNFALEEVALKLYGVNKWANENGVDLSIHIHFNDYPGRRNSSRYSGFSIYVPEDQYPNSRASREIGQSISDQLKNFSATSNHPLEANGMIESQELIAVGSHASQDGAAVLIEYGYIYESRLNNPELRKLVLRELAMETYRGVKSYFDKTDVESSTILPHRFSSNLQNGSEGGEVLALQYALRNDSLYPPPGHSLNDCPINGRFGPCTEAAVRLFQTKHQTEILAPLGLSTPTGVVGPSTIEKLNTL